MAGLRYPDLSRAISGVPSIQGQPASVTSRRPLADRQPPAVEFAVAVEREHSAGDCDGDGKRDARDPRCRGRWSPCGVAVALAEGDGIPEADPTAARLPICAARQPSPVLPLPASPPLPLSLGHLLRTWTDNSVKLLFPMTHTSKSSASRGLF